MKLDIENSKKNIYAKDLNLIDEQLQKIETSNGRISLVGAVTSFSIFASILNTISNLCDTDLKVGLGILNIFIMMLSGFVLDRSIVKITKNNQLKKDLLQKKDIIMKKLEKDEHLDNQFLELSKMLCKKSNIIYFPQK